MILTDAQVAAFGSDGLVIVDDHLRTECCS